MLSEIYNSTIDYLQVIDPSGNADMTLFPKDLSDEDILGMCKFMLLARALDSKILSLQRQGRAVTYAPLVGEEATQIGSALAMGEDDIFVPSFRQHGVYLVRQMPLETFLLYWRGYEEGNIIPKGVHGLPVIVPVATQMVHACGIAFAEKYKKTGASVVAYVGDGGTSEGDFYEALNFAGVWKVPLVTIIENNQWAISIPRSKQTAAVTLAQKADAAGIRAIQVDGNDVVAVYKATKEALASKEPVVIECITYRMSMHTTADDPSKYRSDAETEEWKQRDPIKRIKAYLAKKGLWSDAIEAELAQEQSAVIDAAVEKAEQFKPDPKTMFENIYSYMPEILQEEMDEAEANNYWQG